jgi:hypothetical protein
LIKLGLSQRINSSAAGKRNLQANFATVDGLELRSVLKKLKYASKEEVQYVCSK